MPTREVQKELTLDGVLRQICLHYYKRLPPRFGPFLVKWKEGEEGKNPLYILYMMSTGNLGNLNLLVMKKLLANASKYTYNKMAKTAYFWYC